MKDDICIQGCMECSILPIEKMCKSTIIKVLFQQQPTSSLAQAAQAKMV